MLLNFQIAEAVFARVISAAKDERVVASQILKSQVVDQRQSMKNRKVNIKSFFLLLFLNILGSVR